ncbi:efflux transporter outer membrane subunit [Pseudomonas sp. nanlin1]|uniref:efflux transporter outer membrane subunit n=1 Tax=Pseudomonas sp. nanlin1 TaxID=3040605 RepID=UPI00388E04B6
MRSLCSYALAISTALTAGCTVGPDYQRPDIPLGPRYQSQGPAKVNQAPDDQRGWWKKFDDPTLSQSVSQALAHNLDIDQANARLAQARAGLGAASAALLPSGRVSASAGRAYQSVETPLGQVLDSQPGYSRYGNSYEANLEAGWEVDLFGGLRREREAALADYQAAHVAVAATQLAVAAQTADLYIVIRGLQARIVIARQQMTTLGQLRDKAQLMYEKGAAAQFELSQVEGQLAQVEATVPALEKGLDAAMNALDVMLGSPAGSHREALSVTTRIPTLSAPDAAGTPHDLLRRRPDLILAERRLAAANARIGAAVSEYYPKFSLSALLGSSTTVSGGQLFSSGASQWAGVLGLRWRLFDFARIDAQIDLAKGQEAEALALYRQAALRATEEVENAFSAFGHGQDEIAALSKGEKALVAAKQSQSVAYQTGAASLIDVLRAEERTLAISDARARAQAESARAAVATFKALGGGWDL